MSFASEAVLIAAKDLRIEARSRVATAQILPFGGIVLLLFAFALDPRRNVLPTVAPGLFWIAVLLSSLLAVSRSFAIEADHGARDGLRLAGLDGGAIFLGKAAAVAVELLALEVILLVGVVGLYDVEVHGLVVIVPAAILATVGLAAAGTVYGVLAAGLRVRETLVPLLVLPAVAPVLLAATRAFELALGEELADAWRWTSLLGVFAVVSSMVGVVAFGPLLEES